MRWPFVSRDRLEEAQRRVAALETGMRHMETSMAVLQGRADERFDALLDRYHDLMTRKANAEKLPPAKAPDPEPMDLVMLEVANQARGDSRLFGLLAAYVSTERAKREKGDAHAKSEADLLHDVAFWTPSRNDGDGGGILGGDVPPSIDDLEANG